MKTMPHHTEEPYITAWQDGEQIYPAPEPFYSKEMHDNHVKALAAVTRELNEARKEIARLRKISEDGWRRLREIRTVTSIQAAWDIIAKPDETLYVPLESYVQFTDGTFVEGDEADAYLDRPIIPPL